VGIDQHDVPAFLRKTIEHPVVSVSSESTIDEFADAMVACARSLQAATQSIRKLAEVTARLPEASEPCTEKDKPR